MSSTKRQINKNVTKNTQSSFLHFPVKSKTYDKDHIQPLSGFKQKLSLRFQLNEAPALDTLAQLPTNTSQVKDNKNLPDTKETLKKRARAKFMSVGFIGRLVGLNTKLKKSYINSLECANILYQAHNKLTGKYCNTRWCLVCARIKTAKLINGYMPVLNSMPDKYFVTLTVRNMKANQLPGAIKKMHEQIVLINRVIRERRGIKFQGLRKFECTYNLTADTYHPHFHLIVDSYSVAHLIKEMWMERFPDATYHKAQDIRKADNASCMELFKYFTKIVSKTYSPTTGAKITGVHVVSLDVIFTAIEGKRVFQPMGVKRAVSEEIPNIISEDLIHLANDNHAWAWHGSDWLTPDLIDFETGEVIEPGHKLTGYEPSDNVKIMLQHIEPETDKPETNNTNLIDSFNT